MIIGPKRKHPLPSIDRLKEVLSYDPLTGTLTWKVSRGKVHCGDVAGTVREDGYVFVCLDYTRLGAHQIAWAIMTGVWPTKIVDHRDGKPTNNIWTNLRLATPKESAANRGMYRNNKSGAIGVRERDGRFHAQIVIKGKATFLGSFDNQKDASDAYQTAVKKRDGEFARS